MRIAIAGTGRMGTAMALRLMEKGYAVTVWNRSADKLAPLVAAGAGTAPTPAALAAAADVILTSLMDGAALSAVYEGPDGLVSAPLAHAPLFIETSTVRPAEQQALADKVAAAGGVFLECPVGGSIGPARSGTLLGLAGGDAQAFARAKGVLDALCRRVELVGPVGAGASLKLAINLPLALYFQALGEAYTLCGHLGLDPLWLVDFLSETSGGVNMLKARREALAKALAGEDPGTPGFSVEGIRKDLRTMIAEARARGADLPLAERALGVYDEAGVAGLDASDGAALAGYWPHRPRG